MLTHKHTQFLSQAGSLAMEVARDVLQMFPIAAFALLQLTPAQALASTRTIVHDPSFVLEFPTDAPVVTDPIPASHVFSEGTVLGVVASAYSSTVAQTDASPFTTASGTRVRDGVVAANFLPLGTEVRIGSELYTVEDRMNARYNDTYRADIWMASTADARAFGTRGMVLEVVALP